MTDSFDSFNVTWVTIAVYILVGALIGFTQYVLRRKFPQMATWKVAAISSGLPIAISIVLLGHLYFTSPLSDSRDFPQVRVEWRTEIKKSEEPATWPFVEPVYMLGCLGAYGDYSVYLVRLEDIEAAPDRDKDFLPQYYGLKGSWNGWKKGETQLLSGQSTQVFERYVDRSLRLCKEAESRKDSHVQEPPVKK